jgi:hypothetical protein
MVPALTDFKQDEYEAAVSEAVETFKGQKERGWLSWGAELMVEFAKEVEREGQGLSSEKEASVGEDEQLVTKLLDPTTREELGWPEVMRRIDIIKNGGVRDWEVAENDGGDGDRTEERSAVDKADDEVSKEGMVTAAEDIRKVGGDAKGVGEGKKKVSVEIPPRPDITGQRRKRVAKELPDVGKVSHILPKFFYSLLFRLVRLLHRASGRQDGVRYRARGSDMRAMQTSENEVHLRREAEDGAGGSGGGAEGEEGEEERYS